MRIWCIALISMIAATPALAADFTVGDKVQAWNIDWYDGTIAEIGAGSYAGYYLVRFDKYSTPQYVKASNIRARPGAAPVVTAAATPRAGKYVCMGYNGGTGQFRWYLQLGKSTYQQASPALPAGGYSFNGATKRLEFTSGPYKANNWIGLFSVEREGKTHKIVLRNRAYEAKGPRVNEYANIVCTLSSDSAN